MRLLRAIFVFAGVGSAAEVCTVVVTARQGDTCATISDAAGITVSQFLRANPGVTTCSSLTTGTRYCVDPNYAATTTKPATGASPTPNNPSKPQPSSSLEVTKDGQCGNGLTCVGSAFGDCCSEHGWCGSSPDHCGSKCQAAFGRCGGGSNPNPSSAPVSNVAPTSGGGNVAVTATVYVTSTRVVSTTTTATAAVATATQIIRQTIPVTVTIPVAGGDNGVATTTSTVLVTQTQHSLVFISSTVTTIRTITITDAKQCRTLNATPLPRATRAVVKVEDGPVPLQPGVVADCRTFYKVRGNDSCEDIIKRHNGAFELPQLYAWNRHLSGDCQGLWLEHWICVGV